MTQDKTPNLKKTTKKIEGNLNINEANGEVRHNMPNPTSPLIPKAKEAAKNWFGQIPYGAWINNHRLNPFASQPKNTLEIDLEAPKCESPNKEPRNRFGWIPRMSLIKNYFSNSFSADLKDKPGMSSHNQKLVTLAYVTGILFDFLSFSNNLKFTYLYFNCGQGVFSECNRNLSNIDQSDRLFSIGMTLLSTAISCCRYLYQVKPLQLQYSLLSEQKQALKSMCNNQKSLEGSILVDHIDSTNTLVDDYIKYKDHWLKTLGKAQAYTRFLVYSYFLMIESIFDEFTNTLPSDQKVDSLQQFLAEQNPASYIPTFLIVLFISYGFSTDISSGYINSSVELIEKTITKITELYSKIEESKSRYTIEPEDNAKLVLVHWDIPIHNHEENRNVVSNFREQTQILRHLLEKDQTTADKPHTSATLRMT